MRFSSIILIALLFFGSLCSAQQTPVYPYSYRIFSPFIFNPAIAGSKDFASIDLITGWQGESNSQIISGNARISKKMPGYFTTTEMKEFSNFGMGASFFNEMNSTYHNMGVNATVSYHVALNKKALSYLSYGVTIRGVSNLMDSVPPADNIPGIPAKRTYYPNLDAGIYYYGPNLFAGVSSTNLLGNPESPDSLGKYSIPVSRQYYFLAGYKFILSRSYTMILEPSLLINTDLSSTQKIEDILEPILKLYMQDFCLGTYYNNHNYLSLFFQYKYPRFYIGTFFEFPKETPYFKKQLNIEVALGINFSQYKSRYRNYYHW